MLISDIKRIVEQVSKDKGIEFETLIGTLEEALASAAKKVLGSHVDIEAQYSHESGEIEVFQFKEVVDEVEDDALEIIMADGRELDPECEIGDSLGIKLDTSEFGRIAAQSAKQVIIQKMKEAERNAVYDNFIDRKGEIINGIVQRIDRNGIIVNLGQAEAVLGSREQVPKETYRRGDRIRAYILNVTKDTRGPQIILSRTHPAFLMDLFKTEVPEIAEGVVEIKDAAREPGNRAKIAVASTDPDIDPVGACVGMKGSRVQNVVQELRGEKIDIITWHFDAAKYVCNALAPAEIARVIIDEDNESMEVIVPDEFLSVAIGKRGQNVRLASKLTGWQLDVVSESDYSKSMKKGYESLLSIPSISMILADNLNKAGFYSLEEIKGATVEDLIHVEGMTEELAESIIADTLAIGEPSEEASAASEEPSEKEGDSDDAQDNSAPVEAAVPEDESKQDGPDDPETDQ